MERPVTFTTIARPPSLLFWFAAMMEADNMIIFMGSKARQRASGGVSWIGAGAVRVIQRRPDFHS